MADILEEGGEGKHVANLSGGVTKAKPLDYKPPKGPTSQSHEGPGLGGTNHGCSVNQGKH